VIKQERVVEGKKEETPVNDTWYLGIDIGGSRLRVGLVNSDFGVEEIRSTSTHTGLSPGAVVDLVSRMVRGLRSYHPEKTFRGAGAGFPGPVNFPAGSTFSYTNLLHDAWKGVPLRAMLQEALDLPVVLDNDAHLAGLAEMRLGSGAGFQNAIYLTLSTGIGGAIFIGGRLYRGSLGSAGEFGHMVVHLEGDTCKCGKRGCLMAQASGLALEQRIQCEPSLRSYCQEGDTSREGVRRLLEDALRGEPGALQAVLPVGEWLSVALLNMVEIFNPQTIIVGGGMGNAFLRLFSGKIDTSLRRHLATELAEYCIFQESRLGEENGIIGGAILCKEESSDKWLEHETSSRKKA